MDAEEYYEILAQRKNALHEYSATLLEKIRPITDPLEKEYLEKTRRLFNENSSTKNKMRKFFRLVDEYIGHVSQFFPCKNQCDYCCHYTVQLTSVEAAIIAESTGISAKSLHKRQILPNIKTFGQHTPCPFLKNHSCSIYESRPFFCRYRLVVHPDNIICRFENFELFQKNDPRYSDEIKFSDSIFSISYIQLCGESAQFGDIRQFFPSN